MDDLWHAIEDVAYSEALDQADPIQPLRAFATPPSGPNGEAWNCEQYAQEEGLDCTATVRSQLGSYYFLQFLDLGASPRKRRSSVAQINIAQAAIIPVVEDCDDGAGIDYSWHVHCEAFTEQWSHVHACLYRLRDSARHK